ncbi:MAG: zinc ABC transporter substrate-binding protein, partial [Ignavibacteriales bacterium]|nr:zinc ABC transporter substrate-binding protein [Ignavibacteriales bacterium]
GMQLELWSQQIIDGSRNTNIQIIDCSKGISKMEVPSFKVDASYGDVHPFGNPHYWLDPENVKIILGELVEGLSKISPQDREYFNRNAQQYSQLLDQKMSDWKALAEPLHGARIVTYHSSFSYFAHRFGMEVVDYVEPKSGIPPTPTHTKELIDKIRAGGVHIIGLEQFYEENTPASIASASGAKVVRLSTAVGGLPNTDSYTALVEYNLRALVNALR